MELIVSEATFKYITKTLQEINVKAVFESLGFYDNLIGKIDDNLWLAKNGNSWTIDLKNRTMDNDKIRIFDIKDNKIFIHGFPLTTTQGKQLDSLLNKGDQWSKLPKDVFYKLIEDNDIRGKDLISLCVSNSKINYMCNGGNAQDQQLFKRLLLKEFNITRSTNPREDYIKYSKQTLICQSILTKINEWRAFDISNFEIHGVNNVYDLLYDPDYPEDNDNHYAVGSYMIRSSVPVNNKYFISSIYNDQLYILSPSYIFPYFDEIYDHKFGIVYDYNYMKAYYEHMEERNLTDTEFGKLFMQHQEISIDVLKNYPALFAAELRQNKYFTDRENLRNILRDRNDELMDFISQAVTEETGLEEDMKDLRWTDEEIEFILDLHFRVISNSLKITTIVTCENLMKH